MRCTHVLFKKNSNTTSNLYYSLFSSDNRTGIEGTLHRISAIWDRTDEIIGLTYRVGRHIIGCTKMISDIFPDIKKGKSVLLLGGPGTGKTTLLREISRVLASQKGRAIRVVIVDTSNEIGGFGNVPHSAIGNARRMMVTSRDTQHETMLEAVQNHTPNVIVIDEIGNPDEVRSAKSIRNRGVSLIATAHGQSINSLIKNVDFVKLMGGISRVVIGDQERRATQRTRKTLNERPGAPTFDIVIELLSRSKCRIIWDVGKTVDAILNEESYTAEIRWVEDGNVYYKSKPFKHNEECKREESLSWFDELEEEAVEAHLYTLNNNT